MRRDGNRRTTARLESRDPCGRADGLGFLLRTFTRPAPRMALVHVFGWKQLERIAELFEGALKDESIRIAKRVKRSGVLRRSDSAGESMVIIVPGCATQIRIEAVLRALVGPDSDEPPGPS